MVRDCPCNVNWIRGKGINIKGMRDKEKDDRISAGLEDATRSQIE